MKHPSVLASNYHCRRAKPDGIIQVLNENSYVMAEYSEKTGVMRWHRVVLATQKAAIEQWVISQYPSKAKKAAA